MEVLSVNELKSLCQQRKLPTSGTKETLIERLTKGASAPRSNSSSSSIVAASSGAAAPPVSAAPTGPSSLFPGDYESLTIAQLKDLCRERMLPVGGIKDDLVARLNTSDPQKMSLNQLKVCCRDAGLPVTGTKADLAERVMKNMTSGTGAVLQSKSMDELKELCREHGVPVTGKKEELIDRIKQATSKTKKTTERSSSAKDLTASTGGSASAPPKKKLSVPDYASMTIPQLKEICRERSVMVGGTKDEIVERLVQSPAAAPSSSRPSSASSKRPSVVPSSTAASSPADQSYESMTIPQLKGLCRERTLPAMGNKDELVKRLNDHDDVIRTMFKKLKTTVTLTPAKSSTTGVKRSAASTEEPKPKKVKNSPASSDKPKAKKAKTTAAAVEVPQATKVPGNNKARKSTGGKAPRAIPPQNADRKSPPEEWRPAPSGRFVVYSSFTHPSKNGGRPVAALYESYNLAQAANARADEIFYDQNPWNMIRLEIDDEDVAEDYEGDLLQLKVCPPDSGEWFVGVQDRGTAASSGTVESKTKKAKTSASTQERKVKTAHVARVKKDTAGDTPHVGRYHVYSTCAYPRDNFHTYEGPGQPTYYDSYDLVAIANKRVSFVFYGKNPWGLSRDEMDDLDVDEQWAGGLLQLSVSPPDREAWLVGVKDRGSAADQDGDVIMVSSSETEDEAF